jgi:hypothetical protein
MRSSRNSYGGRLKASPETGERPVRAWKDHVSILMSTLALLISACTFYFNIIREKDDLRVVIEAAPDFEIDYEKLAFGIQVPTYLTFINSGNRPAAVLDVKLFLDQSPKAELHQESCETEKGSATILASSFKPTIIKPSEITSVEVTFGHRRENPDDPIADPIPIEIESAKKKQINALICLRYTISTPDLVAEDRDAPLYHSNIELYRQPSGYFGGADIHRLEPRTLIRTSWPF